MVARPRAARTHQAREIAAEGYRWICGIEFYRGAGYRSGAYAAFRALAAMARSHSFRRCQRYRGVAPSGAGGANASFALITKHYMNSYGAKREDFAKICIAQRDNALSIPHAMMKKKLTLDEYMSARPIADPIHLFDCVMPCAGAEAFVVCREDVVRSLNLPSVRILSTIERHNAFPNDPMQIRGGWELDIGELWSMAALTPKDVDFVQTYDDYPVISMMQFEDLGFCPKGEGPDFVRSHTLTND